jgi:hypothetical protein
VLDRLAAAADGRDDLRVRTAGEIAGLMASPATHQGHELIAAGLLLVSGPVDGDQLLDAVRAGYKRGKGSLAGYDPSDSNQTAQLVGNAQLYERRSSGTCCGGSCVCAIHSSPICLSWPLSGYALAGGLGAAGVTTVAPMLCTTTPIAGGQALIAAHFATVLAGRVAFRVAIPRWHPLGGPVARNRAAYPPRSSPLIPPVAGARRSPGSRWRCQTSQG